MKIKTNINTRAAATAALLIIILSLSSPSPARAADAAPAEKSPCLTFSADASAAFKKADYETAISKFKDARKCWLESSSGAESDNSVTTLDNIAYTYSLIGDNKSAIELYKQVIPLWDKLYGEDSEASAISWNGLGAAYFALYQYEDARDAYEKTLKIAEKVYGKESREAALAHNKLGLSLRTLGDFDNALAQFTAALDISEKTFGKDDANTAIILSNLAQVYENLGQFDKSLDALNRALEINIAKHGENSPNAAVVFSSIATIYYETGKYDEALSEYQKALKILIASYGEESADVAIIYNDIGSIVQARGDYLSALGYFTKSLNIVIKLAGSESIPAAQRYNNIGYVYYTLGDYGEAVKNYTAALDIRKKLLGPEHPDIATGYNNIALVYKTRGDYGKALDLYNEALRITLGAYGETHSATAILYDNIGNVYDAEGDFQRGLGNHIKALAVFKAVYGEDNTETAIAYNNVAAAYDNLGEYSKAADNYLSSLEISRKLFGHDSKNVAMALDNLGIIFHKIGEDRKALEFHNEALGILLKVNGEMHNDTAVTYNNIAIARDFLGEKKEAIEDYLKAMKIWIQIFGEQHPAVAAARNNIGTLYQSVNDDEKAVEYFNAALSSECEPGKAPSPETCSPGETTINSFMFSAQSHIKLHKNAEAAKLFEDAASALDILRGQLQSDASKKLFGQRYYDMFPQGIGAIAALAKETGDDKQLARAYILAEKGMGRVFLEMLGRSSAKISGGLPPEILAEGRRLDAELQLATEDVAYETSKPKENQSQELRTAAYNRMFNAVKASNEYQDKLFAQFPAYADLMRPSPQPLDKILSAVIGEDEAALEYILGDSASWLLIIKRGGVKAVELPKRANIENQIKTMRTKLIASETGGFRLSHTASVLYNTLIAPAREELKGVKSLLVIPTGELYFLPFESLYDNDSGKYLIEDFNIRYAPSLNVLYLSQQTGDKTAPTGKWIGFGDPVYSTDDPRLTGKTGDSAKTPPVTRGLIDQFLSSEMRGKSTIPRIPATGEEVNAIASEVVSEKKSEQTLLGLDASEANVKKMAAQKYSIIHIASHGTLGAGDGFQPALILSTIGDMKGEDGFLQMSEVFDMKTPGALVVLSACETGRGNIEQGEGVAGMGRAFLYAGAKSLVVSLWSVADEQTKNLMVSFYDKLLSGSNPESSLRDAKLEMIKNGLPPFYWAPFVLIGRK